MVLNCLHIDGCSDMGLARTGSANENDLVCIIEKVTSMKLPDQYFAYLDACEIKSIKIAIGGKRAALTGERGAISPCCSFGGMATRVFNPMV